MQDFPHHYKVAAAGEPDGDVSLSSGEIEVIRSAPPAEFGGPGDKWSPETLLVASIADCLILSFRAIARASKFPWTSLTCEVEGTLERIEGVLKFTDFMVEAMLSVPQDANEDRAQRLLQKAEEICLITNSLSSKTRLEATVIKAS